MGSNARGVPSGNLRLFRNILQSKEDPQKSIFIDFSHSETHANHLTLQNLAQIAKEDLVKLLKGEEPKQKFVSHLWLRLLFNQLKF